MPEWAPHNHGIIIYGTTKKEKREIFFFVFWPALPALLNLFIRLTRALSCFEDIARPQGLQVQ